jgi:hypothetical protein
MNVRIINIKLRDLALFLLFNIKMLFTLKINYRYKNENKLKSNLILKILIHHQFIHSLIHLHIHRLN